MGWPVRRKPGRRAWSHVETTFCRSPDVKHFARRLHPTRRSGWGHDPRRKAEEPYLNVWGHSAKSNQLLQYLYINRHRLVTLDEIASNIWGVPLDMCNKSILSSIWVVRKAIGADNNMLQNQYNIGYKLNLEGGEEG